MGHPGYPAKPVPWATSSARRNRHFRALRGNRQHCLYTSLPEMPRPSIATFNVNGLSTGAGKIARLRHGRIVSSVTSLTRQADIVFLQETGLDPLDTFTLSGDFPRPKFQISYDNQSHNNAGTMALLGPKLLEHYRVSKIALDPALAGHALLLEMQPRRFGTCSPFRFLGVYLSSKGSKIRATQLDALSKAPNDLKTFVAGDFNFVTEASDTTLVVRDPADLHQASWFNFLEHFNLREAHQDVHTFLRRSKDPLKTWTSRLDRVYHPFDPAAMLLSHPVARVVRTPNDHFQDPSVSTSGLLAPSLSDHLPVVLSFPKRHLGATQRIPTWVANSRQFHDEFRIQWGAREDSSNPFHSLRRFKGLARATAKRVELTYRNSPQVMGLFSAGLRLFRLISAADQDFDSINQLRGGEPRLAAATAFRLGRWCDAGLSGIVNARVDEPLAPANKTAPPLPSPNLNGQFLHRISSSLPNSRTRLNALKPSALEPPTDDPDRMALIAAEFWGGGVDRDQTGL